MQKMIDHSLLRENIPLLIYALYRINNKRPLYDALFYVFIFPIVALIPIHTLLYANGFNVFTLLDHGWRGWITPIQYSMTILGLFYIINKRTNNVSYATTLSYTIATASGYIYEIPRYFKLQGLEGLLRHNKYSMFRYDYAIIAVFVVILLLREVKIRITRYTFLGFYTYLGFCFFYYCRYGFLQRLKNGKGLTIALYRTPTLFFFITLVMGIQFLYQTKPVKGVFEK